MTSRLQENITFLVTALYQCSNSAYLRIGKDLSVAADGLDDLSDVDKNRLGLVAISLSNSYQELLPLVVDKNARGIMVKAAGVPVPPEIVEETSIALRAAREIEDTFPAEDGGDNLYYVGEFGVNLVKEAEITVSANSPEGAIALFIAHRLIKKMDLENPEFGSMQDEKGLDEIAMRRAHDWRQYSVEDLVLKVAPMLEAEISFKTLDLEGPQI